MAPLFIKESFLRNKEPFRKIKESLFCEKDSLFGCLAENGSNKRTVPLFGGSVEKFGGPVGKFGTSKFSYRGSVLLNSPENWMLSYARARDVTKCPDPDVSMV